MNRIFVVMLITMFSSSAFSNTPKYIYKKSSAVEQESSGHKFFVEALYTNLNQPWGVLKYEFTSNTAFHRPVLIVSERNAKIWLLQQDIIREIEGLPTDVVQYSKGGAEKPGWFDIVQGSEGALYMSYAKKKGALDTLAVISFYLDEDALMDITKKIYAHDVKEIFESNFPTSTARHHGGVLAVNPRIAYDELYLALGSRANRKEAQNKSSHIGDVIMVRSDTQEFKIISYGHRNPQGLFYDQSRNILYSTEHGPMGGDEFNIIEEGKNYGWAVISYGKEYGSGAQVGVGTHKDGMEQPVYYWKESPALSGLIKYEGNQFSMWKGKMIAGALKLQQMYLLSLSYDGREVIKEEQLFSTRFGRIRDIAQDTQGTIYFITDSTRGNLYRLRKK